ncbi:MAG TPA: DUF4258 domain-containing protein [bacterium]|nr:DUF4258 domain-containing protein [bacterium]HOL66275.1 DUF4258 domain-containing protein [bacterium]HPP12579.1 DUF4258 domain-containing protein [bacterium]
MKIVFSKHSLLKIELLKRHGLYLEKDFIEEVVSSPDMVEQGYKNRLIAQKKLGKERVLRVVYEEHPGQILIITLYPGRRQRYEKD